MARIRRIDIANSRDSATSLGVGSTRLIVAGLQRKAADNASIVLVDELEFLANGRQRDRWSR